MSVRAEVVIYVDDPHKIGCPTPADWEAYLNASGEIALHCPNARVAHCPATADLRFRESPQDQIIEIDEEGHVTPPIRGPIRG